MNKTIQYLACLSGMRWSLPFLLCVTAASLLYSTEAERFSNSRYLLGKALLRRAREINESKSNGDVLEEEMSEEEREKVLQTDALEDIFVGSGNHVYESQGKSETSGSRREETSSASDESEAEEAEENDSSPTSGDSNAGEKSDNDESDEDEDEKSEDDDDDDVAETKKDQESQKSQESQESQKSEESTNDEDTSGSGQIQSENAVRHSSDISGSGSGSEQQNDATEQSGSGESTIEKFASQVEASGTEENAAKKSEIETASGDSQDEDEESGSADVIKKGIESLSRLLTPVASGYDFELYSGNTAKNDKEEESEAEGESEKGVSSDTEEVHVKQCKRVCEDPMTYDQCAVPRCDYKMGTIKDLCIYLCKHQTPVCRQQCE